MKYNINPNTIVPGSSGMLHINNCPHSKFIFMWAVLDECSELSS